MAESITKGQLLVFTGGDYSDYEIKGAYVAAKIFNVEKEHRRFLESEDQSERSFEEFLVFIEAIKAVQCKEVNTDIYDNKHSKAAPVVLDIKES
jgi:hypothetical protein